MYVYNSVLNMYVCRISRYCNTHDHPAHHDEVHEDEIESESGLRGAFDGTHRGGAVVRFFDDCVGKPAALIFQYPPNDLAVERRVILDISITQLYVTMLYVEYSCCCSI